MTNYITNEVRIYKNGTKYWFLNGEYHREDGPAIEFATGTKEWYLNGNLHREDGPAVECADGDKFWYLNGKLHRKDGPACEFANGTKEWYLYNGELTEEEFISRTSSACIGKVVEIDGRKYKLTPV